jgi:excisionase family DNA binding protein
MSETDHTLRTFTVPQLAAILHVVPRTAQRYLREGRITGKRVGRHWLVSEEALRRFLATA